MKQLRRSVAYAPTFSVFAVAEMSGLKGPMPKEGQHPIKTGRLPVRRKQAVLGSSGRDEPD
jgi:hypothetical protein